MIIIIVILANIIYIVSITNVVKIVKRKSVETLPRNLPLIKNMPKNILISMAISVLKIWASDFRHV